MSKLYSYIRFSSGQQEKGDSVQRQTMAARKYAAEHGYRYQDTSFNDLGISGWKKTSRDGLERMLEAVQNGSIPQGSLIFVENVDRLTRQGFQHANDLICKIVRAGIKLHFDGESVTFLSPADLNEMVNVMKVALSASLAFDESEKKSKRICAARERQRQQIKQGIPIKYKLPHWIELVDGKFSLTNTDLIREVIRLRQEGNATSTIASILNKQGFTGPRGNPLGPSTIKQWLQSPILYGAIKVDDELVQGYYPALISYDEFSTLYNPQSKPIKENNQNPLSGLLTCGCCGSGMGLKFSISSGASKEKIPNYYCVRQRVAGCDMPSFARLYEYIKPMVSHMKRQTHSDDVDEIQLTNRIADIESLIQSLTDRITTATATVTLNKIDELSREKDEIHQKLKRFDTADPDELKKYFDDPLTFNRVARKLIDEVVVTYKSGGRRKRVFHLQLKQKNGHVVNLTKLSNGEYLISKTEQVVTFAQEDPIFEPWEQ